MQQPCNTFESGILATTPVGIYTDAASPSGALDMTGNVWEWCSTLYRPYPYKLDDGREMLDPAPAPKQNLVTRLLRRDSDDGSSLYRVLRGGSFNGSLVYARCAYRNDGLPVIRNNDFGFRVAQSFRP